MLAKLLKEIRQCCLCEPALPLGANPVIQAHPDARVLIVGQAPGTRVHQTSVPWNDPSGERLRQWLELDRDTFYTPEKIAIMPMGLCYPGKGHSGDLPPRKECAPQWHGRVRNELHNIQLTLLIGQYAQAYYLKDKPDTLTETVREWRRWYPDYLPLPHPSPRNTLWLRKNAWFESEVLPEIRLRMHQILSGESAKWTESEKVKNV